MQVPPEFLAKAEVLRPGRSLGPACSVKCNRRARGAQARRSVARNWMTAFSLDTIRPNPYLILQFNKHITHPGPRFWSHTPDPCQYPEGASQHLLEVYYTLAYVSFYQVVHKGCPLIFEYYRKRRYLWIAHYPTRRFYWSKSIVQ